jgi:maleylpyruvate isomerase
MTDRAVLDMLESATRRLVRSVDAMADVQFAEPSLLPGWTRGHVVAHLTLNAEALAGALEGVREGRRVPMYASQEDRDRDIETLAGTAPGPLRERLLSSTTLIHHAVADLPPDLHDGRIERTPGSDRVFTAGRVGEMRLREVEIHHADLDLDYTFSDWPEEFTLFLLEKDSQVQDGPSLTLHAVDLDRRFAYGDGSGPTISGPGSALAWWATGRDPGDVLTSDSGGLPTQEAW